ncbi:MAG: DUF3237 domain-containing protein [Alcanivorax sp.]|nr:DUF3237 domain-containing protein [Alcanivorax sp.]
MSALLDAAPAALGRIDTRPLFAIKMTVAPPQELGETPFGRRRVAVVTGGEFESARPALNGRVLTGGSDWLTFRDDGVVTLDVRLVLETAGGLTIGMHYNGYRHGPEAVMARLAGGEDVDPAEYYFRAAVRFETAAPALDALNRMVAVATGHRYPDGPLYHVFEVL